MLICRELNSAFDRLCHQVNLTKSKLQEELQTLEVSIEQLKEANKKASFLKYVFIMENFLESN